MKMVLSGLRLPGRGRWKLDAVGEREPPAPVPLDENIREGAQALLLRAVAGADARALDAGEDGDLAEDPHAQPLPLDGGYLAGHRGDALEEVGAAHLDAGRTVDEVRGQQGFERPRVLRANVPHNLTFEAEHGVGQLLLFADTVHPEVLRGLRPGGGRARESNRQHG